MTLANNKRYRYYAALMACVVVVFAVGVGSAAAQQAQIVPQSCQSGPCTLCDIFQLIRNIFLWLLSIGSILAGVALAWGGVLYITSGGNEGRASQAKSAMLNAIIGLIIAWSAFLILVTIFQALVGDASSFLQGNFSGSALQVDCSGGAGEFDLGPPGTGSGG